MLYSESRNLGSQNEICLPPIFLSLAFSYRTRTKASNQFRITSTQVDLVSETAPRPRIAGGGLRHQGHWALQTSRATQTAASFKVSSQKREHWPWNWAGSDLQNEAPTRETNAAGGGGARTSILAFLQLQLPWTVGSTFGRCHSSYKKHQWPLGEPACSHSQWSFLSCCCLHPGQVGSTSPPDSEQSLWLMTCSLCCRTRVCHLPLPCSDNWSILCEFPLVCQEHLPMNW